MGYKMQQEYFGNGELNAIEEILIKEKPQKIFLVTGKNSYASSGAKEKIEPLLSSYKCTHFFDFSVNPKLTEAQKGIDLYQKEKYDLVIAVGGGSVIDTAKAINILANQIGEPEKYITGEKEIKDLGSPLIAIPTTSGSGSEATHFIVIYINKTKYSLAHDCVLPNYSIVDPTLTSNLPKKITAATGMDAFGQAIESYWNVNSTNESKNYAEKSIQLVLSNIESAVNNPTLESREAMAKASNLAGKAIDVTSTTACHAMSYPFTSYFGIPHGHAVALTLGEMLIYNSKITQKSCVDKRGVDYVKNTMGELINILGVKDTQEANIKINSLLKEISLESKLLNFGISSRQLDAVIDNINLERLKNNPRKMSKKRIREIINNIM